MTKPIKDKTKVRVNRGNLRHGLMCGKVPPGAEYIDVRATVFRRGLEDRVLEVKGQITLTDASIIDTATKWVRHELLANRWLRLRAKDMSLDDLLKFSREIAKASQERDKAIKAMDLDRQVPTLTLASYLDEQEESA